MIKSLYVERFRAMKKLTIPLGKKVTVIAGQNATCKSTLLGMIGQPFGLKSERTIFNKPFSTKFSDIFKFSKTYDLPGEHEYQIEFYDSSLFGKNVEYIKSFDNKYIIGIAVKEMFKDDEYFIEKEKEYEQYDRFEYDSIYKKQTILDELLVYKNGKIIKNENNLYTKLIKKYNSGDKNVVLDEWSILGRFYEHKKLIDDYFKNKCV